MSQSAPSAPAGHSGLTVPALSIGTLFFLFGDRCVPPAGRSGGATLPSGATVRAGDLAALVWAVSIWNLRQCGVLTLEPVARKALGMFRIQHVGLGPGQRTMPTAGYEEIVVREVGAGAAHAHEVIHRWYGRDVPDPEERTFEVARRETVRFGIVPEGLAPYWEHFTRVHPVWVRFTQAEPELADTLLETCRRAVRSRQESDDHDV